MFKRGGIDEVCALLLSVAQEQTEPSSSSPSVPSATPAEPSALGPSLAASGQLQTTSGQPQDGALQAPALGNDANASDQSTGTVTFLCNVYNCSHVHCSYIELPLLASTIAVRMQSLFHNFSVFTSRLSLSSRVSLHREITVVGLEAKLLYLDLIHLNTRSPYHDAQTSQPGKKGLVAHTYSTAGTCCYASIIVSRHRK